MAEAQGLKISIFHFSPMRWQLWSPQGGLGHKSARVLTTTFPELRSQRDEMGSGRGWHPDTCRSPARATVPAANCGAGGPRFCLVCQGLGRSEGAKAASHSSAFDSHRQPVSVDASAGLTWYPRMVTPGRAQPGELHVCPALVRPGCRACGVWKGECFQGRFDAWRCSLTRPAADGGDMSTKEMLPGRRTRHDM
jgi:hypothetical protein